MSIKTTTALAVALALGATSAALAQGKTHRHHALSRPATAAATSAFASTAGNSARLALEPPGARIQDQFYHGSAGLGFVPYR